MQVTFNQFYLILFLFGFGYLSSMVLDILLNIVPHKPKIYNIVKPIVEFVWFLLLSALYVLCYYKLKFPTFRWYFVIVTFVAILIERKTFNIILANLRSKLYNCYIKTKVNYDRRKD